MSPEEIRAGSLAAVTTYFEAFEAGDLAKMTDVLAADVVHTLAMSFDGGVEPGLVLADRDEVLGFFSGILRQVSRRDLSDRRTTAGADGNTVFVEAVGDAEIADSGISYKNVYVFKFECADGQVKRITEYANPVAAHKALNIPLG
ncbi:ketosteroid isomerase-like protein [Streptomyces aurantiacus]|uniref:nuclear transport factor 2 family protein n=1 Tax=Streptomyces aurantiacus TaxID=47760 RepID=UPI002792D357|nr:nuclear transport factor 2 family protein [Streptomyces aurantiacus]MDQ0774972.1 ketosteroid isomerase-like protein [Streptomyces aurantiacus]